MVCLIKSVIRSISMHSRTFSFKSYDAIGFDLDHTISLYQLDNVIQLQYRLLVDYLIKNGHDPKAFVQNITSKEIDFIQRGLFMDFKRGNVLKIAHDGTIINGTHGMRKLSEEELKTIYRLNKKWDLTDMFISDILSTWNPPVSDQMRSMMEFFDCQVPLVFSQLIDYLDRLNNSQPYKEYDVWPIILNGIVAMFETNGGFYESLNVNPELYLRKCSLETVEWMKNLKANKLLFLITGSGKKEATFLANYCLGENWKNYFDFIIYNAKKPGFFSQSRPFVEQDINVNCKDSIELTQGNWGELYAFISTRMGLKIPKCVYIGDNLIQDIYATSLTSNIDAVALIEEVSEEKGFLFLENSSKHPYRTYLYSYFWGSYLFSSDDKTLTVWGNLMKKYSKLSIPSLDYLAKEQLNHTFSENWPDSC